MGAWDDIDQGLLGGCRGQRSVAALAAAAGLPPDVVKGLVHGYLGRGWVAVTRPGSGTYVLTLAGQRHLAALAATPLRRAA